MRYEVRFANGDRLRGESLDDARKCIAGPQAARCFGALPSLDLGDAQGEVARPAPRMARLTIRGGDPIEEHFL